MIPLIIGGAIAGTVAYKLLKDDSDDEAKKFESTSKREVSKEYVDKYLTSKREVSKEYVDKYLKNAGKRLKSVSTRRLSNGWVEQTEKYTISEDEVPPHILAKFDELSK